MTTTWTVVTVRSPFSPLAQHTGFAGTWNEADVFASRLTGFHEVWLVTTTDTAILRDSGKTLRIAQTADQKKAAQDRANAIINLLHRRQSNPSLFYQAARRIAAKGDDQAIAEAFVDAGWDWTTICRACS